MYLNICISQNPRYAIPTRTSPVFFCGSQHEENAINFLSLIMETKICYSFPIYSNEKHNLRIAGWNWKSFQYLFWTFRDATANRH